MTAETGKPAYRVNNEPENIMRTKADIQSVTASQIIAWSECRPGYARGYCKEMADVLRKFEKMLQESRIFEAPYGWQYVIEIRGNGVSLIIEEWETSAEEEPAENNAVSGTYELLCVRAPLMTVEEYTNTQEITHVASVSRIRRGKIRCAVKQGREWRIPSLALSVIRGYKPAVYTWMGELQGIPKKYEIFNRYSRADFFQDSSRLNLFHVKLSGNEEEPLEFICNREQRGTIEQIMIAHPDVRCQTDIILRISGEGKE